MRPCYELIPLLKHTYIHTPEGTNYIELTWKNGNPRLLVSEYSPRHARMYVFMSMACSSIKRALVPDEFLNFYEFYFWVCCVNSWMSSCGRWKGKVVDYIFLPSCQLFHTFRFCFSRAPALLLRAPALLLPCSCSCSSPLRW